MKKVTVITLQNVRNYGSVLQAVATQHVFETLGCRVDFINYVRKDFASIYARWQTWCNGMCFSKKLIYGIILYPSFIKQNYIFRTFLEKRLRAQRKKYCSENDFKSYPIDSEIYCTGSDQTWNSNWNLGVLPPLFLSFVPDNVKKISYAASIGKARLDEKEIETTRKYLKRYSAISVREASAVDIITKQLGLPSATHVLDPTLQVDKAFWLSLLSDKQKNRTDKNEYVLLYQLNSNAQLDAYAKKFAKRKGLKLIRFCWRYDQMIKSGYSVVIPEVEEFVSLILNANCVLTDSFHATAFSCNLNVPMVCVYPNEFSSRLASILKLLDLENRQLKSYDDFSFVDNTEVDFTRVNEVLKRERQVGWEFLKKAIEA